MILFIKTLEATELTFICIAISKEVSELNHEEYYEQCAFIEWCRWKGYPYNLIFHIENEGKRSPKEGFLAKRAGKKAGIPDLYLPHASGGYHGLFIEMKAQKGRLTDVQKERIEELKAQGYAVGVCYGACQAIACIEKYVKG